MSSLGRRLPVSGWTMIIVALSLSAWLVMLMMSGTDPRSGGRIYDLLVFLAGWIIMLTAMMLPSELAYVGALSALLRARDRGRIARPTMFGFMSGYGIAWLAYGLAAYLLEAAVTAVPLDAISWSRVGPLLAGTVLVAAGLYQVSSLKQVCLTHCRTPLAFFARNWRDGHWGAMTMGVRHGLVCVGCCWALMAVMFSVGVMSLTWMALLALIMFAEKVLPRGERLTLPIAFLLWGMGIWIAVSPETAPLLKDPFVFGGGICRGL